MYICCIIHIICCTLVYLYDKKGTFYTGVHVVDTELHEQVYYMYSIQFK